MGPRVVIASGCRITLETLAALIKADEIEVIGLADSGEEAILLSRMRQPDIVLLQIDLPGMSSVTVIRVIIEQMPQIKILILPLCHEPVKLGAALSAGAWGVFDPQVGPEEFVNIVRAVFVEETIALYLSGLIRTPDLRRINIDHKKVPDLIDPLTLQERRVLGLIVKGLKNEKIAEQIRVSRDTVKAHIKQIFLKLGVKNRTLAAAIAIKSGLVIDDEKGS